MTPHDQDKILFYAFRYALGRMTYAVSDVVELLLKYQHVITDNHKQLIVKEIQEAIAKGHAGMKMDIQEWEKILNGLEIKQKINLAVRTINSESI